MTDHPAVPPYLSGAAMEALRVPPPAIADAIAEALHALAGGRAWSAPKSSIAPAPGRLFMSMLAASVSPPCAMVKAVGLDAGNRARGLPHIGATLTLMDGESGIPLAVLDGGWITGVRTAALSALAARHLAGTPLRSIAFVGCGEQAWRHLAAFAAEHPLTVVHALSRSEGSARSLAARARDTFGLQARVHAAAGAWLNEADCIVTSVPAAEGLEPFLDPNWIRPGAFVAACDLGRCWRPGLAGLDVVAVDDRTQEAALGHPMLPQADVDTDLVALVSGAHPGRTDATHRTAFVFRGMAVADLAAAWLLYHRTLDAGAAGPPAA